MLTAILFINFLNAVAVAQDNQSLPVKVTLRNSFLLPKKVTIISYQPGDAGNGTEQATMLPESIKQLTFREGKKFI